VYSYRVAFDVQEQSLKIEKDRVEEIKARCSLLEEKRCGPVNNNSKEMKLE